MTVTDKLLFVVGTLSAIIAGMILPSIAMIMATVAAAFTDDSKLNINMNFVASVVVIVACSLFTFAYIFFAFW